MLDFNYEISDIAIWILLIQGAVETPTSSGLSAPQALLVRMVGEAHVYVQASRLKICATSLEVGFQTPRPPSGSFMEESKDRASYRSYLESTKPIRSSYNDDESFEESYGYWMSHQGRILALTETEVEKLHRLSKIRLNTANLKKVEPLAQEAKNTPVYISYVNKNPEVRGSKHWNDLNYALQDEFLLSCFQGYTCWNQKIDDLQMYDRLGTNIAFDLLSDEYFAREFSIDEYDDNIITRLRDLEDTPLGQRLANAVVRNYPDLMGNGSTVDPESDPLLEFEYVDGLDIPGYECLSPDCMRPFIELEKEDLDKHFFHQMGDYRIGEYQRKKILGTFVLPKISVSNSTTNKKGSKLNLWGARPKDIWATSVMITAAIFTVCGYSTLGYSLYATLVVTYILSEIAKHDDDWKA